MNCKLDLMNVKDEMAKVPEAERPLVCGEKYNWDNIGPEIDETKLCALGLKDEGKEEYVDICNVSIFLNTFNSLLFLGR